MKKGWEVRPLGDFVAVDWGNTNLTKKAFVENGKYLGVSAAGCDGRMDYAEHKKHTPVLSAIGARCGMMFIPDEDFTAIKNTITLTPNEELCDPFFLYYLMTLIDLPQRGAGQPFISKGDIQKFNAPLPPLEEQKRIVAVLDEAFAGLTRARAHTEANLQNARELFDCTFARKLTANKFGKSSLLRDHIELLTGFAFKSKGYTDSKDSIRLIRGDNIMQGYFRWDAVKRWPNSERPEYEKYELAAGDVLVAMDRTWVQAGIKYAVINEMDLPALLVQRVARLRCLNSLKSEFLALLIRSKLFESYVLSIQTGLGVPHVSGRQILEFQFQLPTLDEQIELINQFSDFNTSAERLQCEYSNSIYALEQLKQSLLQKAFAGELT